MERSSDTLMTSESIVERIFSIWLVSLTCKGSNAIKPVYCLSTCNNSYVIGVKVSIIIGYVFEMGPLSKITLRDHNLS